MSAFSKAAKVNQRIHRERHQPLRRGHLGLLEKKRDYSQRAADANKKKRALRILKKRALNRNPDEFYFKMINSRLVDGEHREKRTENEHTQEQLRLMQTTDLRYVTFKRAAERSKLDKLRSSLHFIDKTCSTENSHVFFVDSVEEAATFDVAQRLGTCPSLVARKCNRPRTEQLERPSNLPDLDEQTARKLRLASSKRYQELENRIRRESELSVVQRKLEMQRHLQDSRKQGQPKLLRPASRSQAPTYAWVAERKP